MHENGLANLLEISVELDNGLDSKLTQKSLPIPILVSCRKDYIKPSLIKRKRDIESTSTPLDQTQFN